MDISKYKPEETDKSSAVGKFINDYFIEPSFISAITYLNLFILYFVLAIVILGREPSPFLMFFYLPVIYMISMMRKSRMETNRLEIAHRIPQFADALANALSLGQTLEAAFKQATYYLRGKIQKELNLLVLKNALGRNIGQLLRDLDSRFPNTGFVYLISLLEAYSELGVGISPLLKKISITLAEREKAESKIKTILSAGSGYAKLTIVIFSLIFVVLGFLLKKQIVLLFTPTLEPILIFLCIWTGIGILVVMRITSLEFARNFALVPLIKNFKQSEKMTFDDFLKYSGVQWTPFKRKLLLATPLLVGFFVSYLTSRFNDGPIAILFGFILGTAMCWGLIKYIIKGMFEDQLIKLIETFPDLLQIFSIGLNSGLNVYLAFEFAVDALKENSPRLLLEELTRTKFAIECGENPSVTWQKLADKLPFETVVDFSDIMVIAPMHGESIINSINHMILSYQEKKLTLIEKKAVSLSQIVIPLIIAAFFPLFVFVIFAPLFIRISDVFH